jgi:hypothetical protein
MSNVIKLPSPYTIHQFFEEVDAEVSQFEAVRAIVSMYNENGDLVTVEYKMSQRDLAFISCEYSRLATLRPDQIIDENEAD